MHSVIAYVDGFNLYHGLKEAQWKKYYWLDIHALCLDMIKDSQDLVLVKYFTARIAHPEDKRRRQQTYLEAITINPRVRPIYGKYKSAPHKCVKCGHVDNTPTEKMTDVNLTIHLLKDALEHQFRTALLVTGDSDFSGLIQMVRTVHKDKSIVVAFPPKRRTKEIAAAATASFVIGKRRIAKCQLPDQIEKPDGYVLRRPEAWTAEVADAEVAQNRVRAARRGGLDL